MTDANELFGLVQAVINDMKVATAHSAQARSLADQASQSLLISIEKLKDSRPWVRRQIEVIDTALSRLGQLFYTLISDYVREAMAQLEEAKRLLQQYYERSEFMISELEKRYAILQHSRLEHELGDADTAFLSAIDQITAYIERL